jgi:hypothetical protein
MPAAMDSGFRMRKYGMGDVLTSRVKWATTYLYTPRCVYFSYTSHKAVYKYELRR